jgi:hypothetical protein
MTICGVYENPARAVYSKLAIASDIGPSLEAKSRARRKRETNGTTRPASSPTAFATPKRVLNRPD